MKIERLSSNKIKVTVTPGELTVWDINPKAISPDSPQLREFITALLAQSADETGFDLTSASILVEARPQGSDYVFVITRMAQGFDQTQRELTKAIIRKKLLNGQFRAKQSETPASSYYGFDSLADFAALLRTAGCENLAGTALYQVGSQYYFAVNDALVEHKHLCALASEFAASAHGNSFGAYLAEHGRVFAESDRFAALARCYE